MQTQTTTATAKTQTRAKAPSKPAKATKKPATVPGPTLAQQTASAAATAQQTAQHIASKRPFCGYSVPKGTAQLPKRCPALLALGKAPKLATEHTKAAWQAVQNVVSAHAGAAPAAVVLAALAQLNHSSFFGYALRSKWLVEA